MYYLMIPGLVALIWCTVVYVTSHKGEGQIRRWEEHFADEVPLDPHHDVEDEDVRAMLKEYQDAGITLHKVSVPTYLHLAWIF